MIRTSILVLLSVLSLRVIAQTEEKKDGVVFYSHSKQGSLNIRTNGWGGSYTKGWIKRGYKTNLLECSFNFVKHEKEVKTYFQDPSARP
jgi:hypothetical protein